MKATKSILILALAFATFHLKAQEIKTIGNNTPKELKTYGGFGGASVGITKLYDQTEMTIGGRGGVLINRKWAFGGVGMAAGNFSSLDTNQTAKGDVALGLVGLFAEYYLSLESPVHVSFPLAISAGKANMWQSTSKSFMSQNVMAFEPGVNINFNVKKYFIPAIHISYRWVTGPANQGFDYGKLNSINVGFEFNFGSY